MIIKIPENLKERKIFKKILPFIDEENIIAIIGPRQSGKTSLLYLLIKHLLTFVPPSQIIYLDLENIFVLEEMNKIKDFDQFLIFLKKYGADIKKRIFIFIDEIQYLDNPSSFLKYLHDHYKPQLKFFVSGSSSFEIKNKFKERLTGRVYHFYLFPLDFEEFLSFKKEKKEEFSLLFEEFVRYGGYPAIVKKDDFLVKEKELEEIYSLYIKKDIKDLGHIEDIFAFNKLVKALADQIGNLVNELELANFCQLSRQTIRKYLFLLENTFVIKLVSPFFTNKRKELAKMPKIYFIDNGLRNSVFGDYPFPIKNQEFSHLVENFVASELMKKGDFEREEIRFWRTQTKQEVDFVYLKKNEIIPIEVKYIPSKKQKIPYSLKTFINQYQPKKAVIITRDFLNEEKLGLTKVLFIPPWKLNEVI